jgi:hypothetical protein
VASASRFADEYARSEPVHLPAVLTYLGSSAQWFPEERNNAQAVQSNANVRLLFRYDFRAKVIVHAWVDDETTLQRA